jgi:hypothetical protein
MIGIDIGLSYNIYRWNINKKELSYNYSYCDLGKRCIVKINNNLIFKNIHYTDRKDKWDKFLRGGVIAPT